MSDTNNRHDNVASASSTANRDLTLRAMTLGDLQDVSRVFDEVWPQAAPLTGTPMAYELARYFVLEYMRSATASCVAVTADGEFAGVTLARIDGQPLAFPQTEGMLGDLRQIIDENPIAKMMRSGFDHFRATDHQLELRSGVGQSTQAELLLFMVNPAVKGHGVGGALWNALLQGFRANGVHAFYLHTDTSCDYTYYEHHGLQRVAERLRADHPEDNGRADGIRDDMFVYRGEVPAV